ncbi:apolipoprotein B-100-like [Alosa sapidissima]|uniref:apolipoprotein B-100-like n=1 Tax=Alosa sapidissima TaxID=34773 RepID=UPI001C0813E9|nr:apolipoprotein B-100-like [Alosa sapidissima]
MGDTKLCLLLLLSTALAQQDVGSAEESTPTCLLAKRYKNFRNYVYQYEAETYNTVNGASDTKNGPKVSCKVEIDVPQTCSFVLRTTECSLSELVEAPSDGAPVYRPSAEADAFRAAMEKNSLKVAVKGETEVKLFPEQDEPTNILNIKRGIVSALMVPSLEEDKNNNMATVHGVCQTAGIKINAREDIATDVTITRDLSACDGFVAQREATSPLAIITGMHYPLSKLIESTQTCTYQFDNQKKHMTSGSCTEKHILLPFSNKNEYGVSSMVKQTLTLEGTNKINDRIFDYEEANLKTLSMEAADDKNAIQTTEVMLATFKELISLPDSQGHQRASTFQKLVSELRALTYETMKPALKEMVDTSVPLTFQALGQCGTPECTSAILQSLRHFDVDALEIDAATYAVARLSNPSARLVQDILEMAKYKQSKSIMFALSHVAMRQFVAEGKITPEIVAVSEFVASILGADCAGEKDVTFLTLRAIGNMGQVMEQADPTLKSTLLKCMRQPTTTLSVQVAAIQAFRQMSLTDEVRSNLQRVSQYGKGAVQKRLAAYLMVMRTPEASNIEMVKKILTQDQNVQVKAFVASHVNNIINSNDPQTSKWGRDLAEGLQDIEVDASGDIREYSRNYKTDAHIPQGDVHTSMQGNVIFDPSSQLPREVMLQTTLQVFGERVDLWEFGMEGKGFEPTIEALFGKNGFFPDTVSKAMYWTGDKMPEKMVKILENWGIQLKTDKQVPENLMREVVRNFNKLAKNVKAQETPEAMAYLRILGTELGYIKASELREYAEWTHMYTTGLAMQMSKHYLQVWTSGTENTVTAHYIFMDNGFSLPTATGFPLKVALSGTIVPRAKGGLNIAQPVKELSFMPSMGLEFVTKMGVHIPKFMDAGLEMHTNMYHESKLNAKITMGKNQIKLSIPAPEGSTQFFRVSNRLLSVSSGQATLMPSVSEARTNVQECSPLFSGIKYCSTARYSMANSDEAPYFPLNGETKFAVDIEPTGEVSEYTATVTYDVLSEGKEGRQKVDSIKVALKAEGSQPTEATAAIKYNRNRNVVTTSIQIPDYNVEAGIKVGMTDSKARGKQITIDVSNHNIPKMSLIARAKMEAMREGLVQAQLIVPSMSTDATLTATLRKDADLTLEVESDIKLPETSSLQRVTFIYGEENMKVQVKSDMNTEIHKMLPSTEAVQNWLEQLSQDILDQKVVKTDMKLRHIYNKAIEASQIWMDKVSTNAPYIAQLKQNMPELVMPTMPEKLYLQTEGAFKYQFNKDTITVTIPLPMGGKSSEDLRIPLVVRTPELSVHQVGLMVHSQEFTVPAFSIPSEYDLTLPLFGMAEVSAKVNSNLYNWEATISAGNDSVEAPAYVAKYRIAADSPIDILSYTTEGSARISDAPLETLKTTVTFTLNHKYLDTRVNMEQSNIIQDSVKATGLYEIEAFSPLGMQTSLKCTLQTSVASKINGDINVDGSFTLGSVSGSTSLSSTFLVNPGTEATAESTFRVSTPIAQIRNKMKLSVTPDQKFFESTTNVNHEAIKHTTKLNIEHKNAEFTVKTDCVTKAAERMLRNQFDLFATMEKVSVRFDSQVDDQANRALAAIMASLDNNGLEMNTDASLNYHENRSAHKGVLLLNRNGLTTSCTTNLQIFALNVENAVQGNIDSTGATMSVSGKGTFQENSAELKIDGKAGMSEVHLNGLFKADLFNGNTRNLVNFRLNEDGLVLSDSMAASYNEITTDTTHSLKINLESLKFTSVSDNIISESNSYKHDISVDVHRYILAMIVNNDLKILGANFINNAKFDAEPFKMSATGLLKGAYGEEELRHTYEITYADKTASAKCTNNGKLLGAQMTHSSELEITGLSAKYNAEARFNSPVLRLSGTMTTDVKPFTVTVDGIVNSDGELNLYGKQTGDLYSKFLLKAEPLHITHSLECRASSSHQLDNGVTVETSFQNKIDSLLVPEEQSISMKMESKVNNHAFNQEVTAYNKAERMGMELTGAISTNLLNKDGDNNQDFAISGFLKYDKNSDSHVIEMPFMDILPVIMEKLTMTLQRVTRHTIDMLEEVDAKYNIRATFEEKTIELKEVIESFDVNIFVQDLKNFINSISIDKYVQIVRDIVPTEEITRVLKSIWQTIVTWVKKNNIVEKLNAVYLKVEEIVAQYEIENMIEQAMNNAVEIMKQYKVKETMQSAVDTLKSVDFQPLIEKFTEMQNKLAEELKAFDFQQMMDDLKEYLNRILENIKSIDFESYAKVAKQKFVEMSRVPCFGKLYGEFKITSPEHNLETTAEFLNSTTTSETPEFSATLNSQLTSTFDLLAYNLDATAHIAAPKRNRLSLTESVKVNHMSFSVDHQGSATLYGITGQASAKTTAKATTEPYTAEFVNNAFLAVESGFSTTLETSYNHKVNMPVANIFSETTMTQKSLAQLEAGTITVTMGNEGSGKWAIFEYSDEGTHKSDLEIVLNPETAKITFSAVTNSDLLKMKQNMNAEATPFSRINMDARAETETSFIKSSIVELKGEAQVEEPRLLLTATHNTEMTGRVEGVIANSLEFEVTPFEVRFDSKNKENTKLSFPLKMSGKVDLQNDFAFTINPAEQKSSWTGLARFNQYKYSHFFTMGNGEKEMHVFATLNGDANLDMLMVPIDIPEMTVPFIGITTPSVNGLSLWEDAGLRKILITPQQTFSLDSKLKYTKNPEMMTVEIDMEPVFNAINKNVNVVRKHLEQGKDKAADLLSTSYNQAKEQYEKLNIEVPNTIPMPAISMPTLHMPAVLRKIKLPKVSMPKMQQTLLIPTMGDLNYEFSIKTAMLTLNANADLLNQDNIIARFNAQSASEFPILNAKSSGTSTLNTAGMSLGTTLSLEHAMLEGSHTGTITLNKEVTEASIANVAKINLPSVAVEIHQELTGNPVEGLNIFMSSPSAGLLGVQMQTKSATNLNGRLYSRYPSEPQTDVDILGIEMNVDSNKLNIQSSWNMEVPREMLLGIKERVPEITSTFNIKDMMSDQADAVYEIINRLQVSLQRAVEYLKDQGQVMYARAADKIRDTDLFELPSIVSENAKILLEKYEKLFTTLVDAALTFLRETKLEVPGYDEKLSIFEIYAEISTFIGDFTEDAITRIPEMLASYSEAAIEYIRNVEFTMPGSSHIVSGREILDDLTTFFKKIQRQIITTVKDLSNISLETIVEKLSQFMLISIDRTKEFITSLTSQDLNIVVKWAKDVYTDFIDSRIVRRITDRAAEALSVAEQYYMQLKSKFDEVFVDFSLEQLNADIQAWIQSIIERLTDFQNNITEYLVEVSKKIKAHVTVSDDKIDVTIPFPFKLA